MTEAAERIRRQVMPTLRKHGVVRAGLFGSIARGEEHAGSDVDLLVEFECGKTLFDLVELRLELAELLGREADVVTYAALHPKLRERILGEEIRVL